MKPFAICLLLLLGGCEAAVLGVNLGLGVMGPLFTPLFKSHERTPLAHEFDHVSQTSPQP